MTIPTCMYIAKLSKYTDLYVYVAEAERNGVLEMGSLMRWMKRRGASLAWRMDLANTERQRWMLGLTVARQDRERS